PRQPTSVEKKGEKEKEKANGVNNVKQCDTYLILTQNLLPVIYKLCKKKKKGDVMIVFRASPMTHISEDPARYLHRRRALVKVVSRGASPVTTRCPIQIRSRPPVETKESSDLVNQFKKAIVCQ